MRRREADLRARHRPPPVIETRVGRIGVVICYDLEFPELTRSVALDGAQLLVVPTNWPLEPRPDGERPPEVLIAMAASRVNRMAVACADRVGPERSMQWTGGTTIIGVDGWVAAESREPGLLTADIDLEPALDKRRTEHADAFGDRRPELYGALARSQDLPTPASKPCTCKHQELPPISFKEMPDDRRA